MSLQFKELRASVLSKKELAERMNVDIRTVTNWEKEEGTVPSLSACYDLAGILGVSTYRIYRCFMEEGVKEEAESHTPEFLTFMEDSYMIKNRSYHGCLLYQSNVFAFRSIELLKSNELDGMMFTDENYNLVPVPAEYIQSIVPISYENGCYTCMVNVTIPVFKDMIAEINEKGKAGLTLILFGC